MSVSEDGSNSPGCLVLWSQAEQGSGSILCDPRCCLIFRVSGSPYGLWTWYLAKMTLDTQSSCQVLELNAFLTTLNWIISLSVVKRIVAFLLWRIMKIKQDIFLTFSTNHSSANTVCVCVRVRVQAHVHACTHIHTPEWLGLSLWLLLTEGFMRTEYMDWISGLIRNFDKLKRFPKVNKIQAWWPRPENPASSRGWGRWLTNQSLPGLQSEFRSSLGHLGTLSQKKKKLPRGRGDGAHL